MPSRIIGRAECPECGFESAHVKESEKCLYRYCPECGINGPHARTDRQRRNMLANTRLIEPSAEPNPSPTAPKAEPKASPSPTEPTPTGSATTTEPPKKRRGLF